VLAETLKAEGLGLVSDGTDNHLVLVKTDSVGLSGKDAEGLLEKAGMTCNKNMVPKDSRSPFVTSGVRLGTPAITTRGLKETQVKQMALWIAQVLKNPRDQQKHLKIKEEVKALCKIFPVYP
jgi:glycine hydroxymethyltransferase